VNHLVDMGCFPGTHGAKGAEGGGGESFLFADTPPVVVWDTTTVLYVWRARQMIEAISTLTDYFRAAAASCGGSTAGAFFAVTYSTCTCSMVPLNLNGTLS
jgi:hypothetical protein